MNTTRPDDFPEFLWKQMMRADQGNGDLCADIAQQIIQWADGRHPDALGMVLDTLRETRAYAISLEVLEAAWNSTAPEGFRAQIAQDWVGSVLFGVGDAEGALVVAEHIGKTSNRMGPGFLSDFADLLMEWGLLKAAYTILKQAYEKSPGDLSIRYNLGTCEKFLGNWPEAKDAFEFVSRHQKNNDSVLHNLLLASIAADDVPLGNRCREKIESLSSPAPWRIGEMIQIEFRATETSSAEVLYAERVGPHQVRLRGIPNHHSHVSFDDLVLVDFQPQHYPQQEGQPLLLFPVLKYLSAGGYRRAVFQRPSVEDAQRLHTQFENAGFPARLDKKGVHVIVGITENRELEAQAILAKVQAD